MQSKQNPTKKELRSGIYKPRLTIGHRINAHGSQVMLKIELPARRSLGEAWVFA